MRIPTFIVSAVLCTACQTYSNVAIPALEPSNDVRITLSAAGSDEVTHLVGPHVSALEGRIISVDTGSVRVAVRDLVHSDGSFNMYHDEIFAIPRSAISTTEVKRVSRGRSLLLAGAIVAGTAVAANTNGGWRKRA